MGERYGAPEGSLNVVEMLCQTMTILIERHTKHVISGGDIARYVRMKTIAACLIEGDRKNSGFMLMLHHSMREDVRREHIERVIVGLMPYKRQKDGEIERDYFWNRGNSEYVAESTSLLFGSTDHGLLGLGLASHTRIELRKLLCRRLNEMIARPHQAVSVGMPYSMECNSLFGFVPAFYHSTAPAFLADVIEEVVRSESARYAEKKSL